MKNKSRVMHVLARLQQDEYKCQQGHNNMNADTDKDATRS